MMPSLSPACAREIPGVGGNLLVLLINILITQPEKGIYIMSLEDQADCGLDLLLN
jgi:hypothetical protein